MLSFLISTARLVIDPVFLIGGFLTGYLFHADMKRLAWGLLLFVLPALPATWAVFNDGIFAGTLAKIAAASIVASVSYWGLETARTRPRRAQGG